MTVLDNVLTETEMIFLANHILLSQGAQDKILLGHAPGLLESGV